MQSTASMNATFTYQPMTTREDVARTLEAIRKCDERVRNDPVYARQRLIATGMYTKTGKIKKQFRWC
jgi:hypothetical protein